MRLHRLEFTAIGPFAGHEVIDFTAFDDSGIFLLEGPTGAGKSTIIDAIAFALYGDVARQKDASKDRLRSDLAPASLRSEVDLVFETSAGIHRVHRAPTYTPKGRKSARNEPATLVRVVEDPASEDGYRTVAALERGNRQVDPEIRRLVGLSKEQFLQTVVLPQGKFAEFLTATSQEREGVLRDIFDTRVFQDLQFRLVAEGQRSRARVEEAEEGARRAFEVLEAAALALGAESSPDAAARIIPSSVLTPHPPAGVDPLGDDPEAALERAASLEASASALHQAAAAALPMLAAAAKEAAEGLEAARTLNARLDERAGLLEASARLDERRPQIEALRAERADATRSARVIPALDAAEASEIAFDSAVEGLSAALDALRPTRPELSASPAGGPDPAWSQDLHARLKEATASLTEDRARIRDLVELEGSLPERRAGLADSRSLLSELHDASSALGARIDAAPRSIADLEARRSRALAERSALADAPSRAESLALRLARARTIPALRLGREARLAEEAEALEAARGAGLAARAAHEAWLANTGAALADALEEGAPCPVCGSLEHPRPATPPGGAPISKERVEELDAAKQRADEALVSARRASIDAESALCAAIEGAEGDADELEERLDAARAEISRADELGSEISRLEEELVRAREELDAHRAEATRLTSEIATLDAEVAQAAARLDEDEARCRAAAQGARSLAALDARLSEELETLDAVSGALVEWDRARRSLDSARAAALAALDEAGFTADGSGAEAARALVRTRARLEEIDAAVTDFDARVLSIGQGLASERLRGLESASRVDLSPLEGALEEAERKRDLAQHRLGFLEGGRDRVLEAAGVFRSARSGLDAARAEAGPIRRLAGIADATSKENLVATPLSAWVLVSRLDEVLSAANPRLLAISSGRYELISTPDDGTSSRKSGLGLKIIDHDTEESRSTLTLSGGETFYTSLALALGLADVVASEAGGIELRTMFIDEGFGSLDAATLDLVMTQLHALRDSGRTVGVISHVEEMARQIPDQIRIRPGGRAGSTLSVRA